MKQKKFNEWGDMNQYTYSKYTTLKGNLNLQFMKMEHKMADLIEKFNEANNENIKIDTNALIEAYIPDEVNLQIYLIKDSLKTLKNFKYFKNDFPNEKVVQCLRTLNDGKKYKITKGEKK